jgi:hypothetical protein
MLHRSMTKKEMLVDKQTNSDLNVADNSTAQGFPIKADGKRQLPLYQFWGMYKRK